jgi:hypothetical protein
MFGRKKKTKPDFIETISNRSTVLSIADSRAGLDFLVGFFSTIRPRPVAVIVPPPRIFGR